jgi:hypothetical protein
VLLLCVGGGLDRGNRRPLLSKEQMPSGRWSLLGPTTIERVRILPTWSPRLEWGCLGLEADNVSGRKEQTLDTKGFAG